MVEPAPDRVEVETDRTGSGRAEEVSVSFVRSPRDVLRVVVFAVLTLLGVLVARLAQRAVVGFEEDLFAVFDGLPSPAQRTLAFTLQVSVVLAGMVVILVPVVRRNLRMFGYLFVGSTAAWGLMTLVARFVERPGTASVADRAATASASYPSAVAVAELAAAFVILGVFVSRRWRRAGAIVLAVVTVLRLFAPEPFPADVLIALALGGLVGSAVLLAFGRPDRRPTLDAVRAALVDAGVPVAELRAAKVDARGSTPYFATLDDGTGVFVKVLGKEERSADLLFRIYRFLRLKNVGDDRPFSSLRRAVEHEALVSLYARDSGIRTPRMRGVVDVGSGSMLLAYDMIDGVSLDGVPDDEVTDDIMRAAWEQIAQLRRRRIAHRDLRRANLFVATDGVPWLIDFGFSELAASDVLLAADVAQMLASFAVVATPERTVRCAVEVLGADTVATALPRLQFPALSGATQTALKKQKGRLKELQQAVVDQCGVDHVEFEPLQRVNGKSLFMIAVLAVATYVLVPQLADLPAIFEQIKQASWNWLPVVLAMSLLTYVGATISLSGAVPSHLPAVPTFLTQLGSSFASKLAPAGLGGMALNIRYLQRRGVDEAVAASSVGLNSVAGLVGHVTLTLIFGLWAGKRAFGEIKLPNPKWILVGAAVVVVLGVVTMAVPFSRRLVQTKLVPILRRARGGIAEVIRRPGKLAVLLGGSMIVTLSYLLGVYFATRAFGGGLSLATVGIVYLTGSAIATAAPTPGGLGAMEAALIAGLVAVGMNNDIAVPAVFLFRFATFWLPILPGWLCFLWLQRHEYI